MKPETKHTLNCVFSHSLLTILFILLFVYSFAYLSDDLIVRHEKAHQQIAEEFGAAYCSNISIVYVYDDSGHILKGTTYYNASCLSDARIEGLLIAQANNEVFGNHIFSVFRAILVSGFIICFCIIFLSYIYHINKKNEN